MDPSSYTWQSLDTVTASETEGLDVAELRIPGFTILAHGDVTRVGECSGLPALSSGRTVELSRLTPGFCAPGEAAVLRPLAEPHLSRNPLLLVPQPDGGILLRTAGSRTRIQVDGVEVYDQRQLSFEHIARGVVLLLAERVALVLHFLDPAPPNDVPRFGLVGDSTGLLQVRQGMAQVADLDVPVLIRGETGTGKELVARGIHQASRRQSGPLVAVNMGALPASLAAAELFGASKGAFTGAHRQRKGFFSRAQGGSLFLDEIGETPFEVQGMLLRTLETNEVLPVGSERPEPVDARILAATDAVLETAIEEGRFRAPLLHRLSGYEVWLPPLRHRRDDIGRLLVHFLRQELAVLEESWRLESGGKQAWLPASLVARLAIYDWPGNVRQLRNVARQLVIAHRGARRLALTPRIEQLMEEGQPPASVADGPGTAPKPKDSPRPKAIGAQPMHEDTPHSSESLVYDRPVLRTLVSLGLLPKTSTVKSLHPPHDLQGQLERSARRLLADFDGYEIEKNASFLLLFNRPLDAIGYALELQELARGLAQGTEASLPLGVAIHLGEIVVRRNPAADVARGARPFEIEGQARALVEQIWPLTRGGRILITRVACELAKQSLRQEDPAAAEELQWFSHGDFPLAAATDGLEILALGHSQEDDTPLDAPLPVEDGIFPKDGGAPPSAAASKPRYRQPDEVSEDELLAALRAHAFKLQPTAAALRLSRTSLYALIEKSSRIRKAKDLTIEEIEGSRQRCDNDMDRMAADLEVSRKGLRRRMTQLGMP